MSANRMRNSKTPTSNRKKSFITRGGKEVIRKSLLIMHDSLESISIIEIKPCIKNHTEIQDFMDVGDNAQFYDKEKQGDSVIDPNKYDYKY